MGVVTMGGDIIGIDVTIGIVYVGIGLGIIYGAMYMAFFSWSHVYGLLLLWCLGGRGDWECLGGRRECRFQCFLDLGGAGALKPRKAAGAFRRWRRGITGIVVLFGNLLVSVSGGVEGGACEKVPPQNVQ
jgi:hypothetical protein